MGKYVRRGFTLIELIVVIVILGILAAIAIPSYNTVKQRAVDRMAEETAEAVYRNAEALAAFDGRAVIDQDLSTSASETNNATFVDPDPAPGNLNNSNGCVEVSITSGGVTGVAEVDAAGTVTSSGVTADGACGT